MKILIATRNPAKLRDMKAILESILVAEFFSPDDIDPDYEVVEDRPTFEENAIKKAKEWGQKSGYITIADDGGFEIDALGGEPGVLSRRWPGYEADDDTLISMALEKLQNVPKEARGAKLRTVIALYIPHQDTVHTAEGEFAGIITEEVSPIREDGYPFRSIFWVPFLNKYYIEMTHEEHATHNHRMRAVREIIEFLQNL